MNVAEPLNSDSIPASSFSFPLVPVVPVVPFERHKMCYRIAWMSESCADLIHQCRDAQIVFRSHILRQVGRPLLTEFFERFTHVLPSKYFLLGSEQSFCTVLLLICVYISPGGAETLV